jgi:hypothetical protein
VNDLKKTANHLSSSAQLYCGKSKLNITTVDKKISSISLDPHIAKRTPPTGCNRETNLPNPQGEKKHLILRESHGRSRSKGTNLSFAAGDGGGSARRSKRREGEEAEP